MTALINKLQDFAAKKVGQEKARAIVQLLCFCVVGAINTAVDTGMFSLIYYVLLGGNESLYPIPFALGYLAGVACSFILNKLFTFRDRGSAKRQWLPFLIINLITLGIGQGAMYLLSLVPVTGVLAKLLTVPVTLVVNFIGSKFIVFKKAE